MTRGICEKNWRILIPSWPTSSLPSLARGAPCRRRSRQPVTLAAAAAAAAADCCHPRRRSHPCRRAACVPPPVPLDKLQEVQLSSFIPRFELFPRVEYRAIWAKKPPAATLC